MAASVSSQCWPLLMIFSYLSWDFPVLHMMSNFGLYPGHFEYYIIKLWVPFKSSILTASQPIRFKIYVLAHSCRLWLKCHFSLQSLCSAIFFHLTRVLVTGFSTVVFSVWVGEWEICLITSEWGQKTGFYALTHLKRKGGSPRPCRRDGIKILPQATQDRDACSLLL